MNRFQIANLVRKTPKGGTTDVRQTDFGEGFNPTDVLDLIVGACQEFTVSRCFLENTITFRRRAEPTPEGVRTYVTPERAGEFRKSDDGLFYALARPAFDDDEQSPVEGIEALTNDQVRKRDEAFGAEPCTKAAKVYQAICGRCGCITSGYQAGKTRCAYGCGNNVDLA